MPNGMDGWAAQLMEQVNPFGNKPKPVNGGKRGEELFNLILSSLEEIYGDVGAVIAGGAVRDAAAGVTDHKDVDVFLPISWRKFNDHYPELGWGPLRKVQHDNYNKKAKNVGCFFDTLARGQSAVQGVNVDLVFMEKPLTMEDVATFPVFAQRGVYRLDGGLALSPEARSDVESKVFTIDPTITDKDRIKRIAEKVKGWQQREAYKDWKVIEPETHEWREAKEEQKVEDAKTKTISTADHYFIQMQRAELMDNQLVNELEWRVLR